MAIFDVDKIDRVGMDATSDGVMTAVYLKEVVDDFSAMVPNNGKAVQHRHGCSGIDGTTFGKIPAARTIAITCSFPMAFTAISSARTTIIR